MADDLELEKSLRETKAKLAAVTAERDRLLTPIPETEACGYALANMERLLNAPEGSAAAKLAMIIAQWTLAIDDVKKLKAQLAANEAARRFDR